MKRWQKLAILYAVIELCILAVLVFIAGDFNVMQWEVPLGDATPKMGKVFARFIVVFANASVIGMIIIATEDAFKGKKK